MAEFNGELLTKLTTIGVRPTGSTPTKRLLIDIRTLRSEVLEGVARQVAQITAAPAFVLLGQTSVDVYIVAEVTASEVVRRLEYSRDAIAEWTVTGATRP